MMRTRHFLWMVLLFFAVALSRPVEVGAQYQPCPSGSGPGGIVAGGNYAPQDLTQEQRDWLFHAFGHEGQASVGYGGEPCGQTPPPAPPAEPSFGCATTETGPDGIHVGGYDPTSLSQNQRQWLWERFGHPGTSPVGYGGENCAAVNGTFDQPPQPNDNNTTTGDSAPSNPGNNNDSTGSNTPPSGDAGSNGGSGANTSSHPSSGAPSAGSLTSAQQPGVDGGVDLIGVCYALGFSGAQNSNGRGDGWVCTGGSGWNVNWNKVCVLVYGDDFSASNPDNGANNWRCTQNGGGGNSASLTLQATAGLKVRTGPGQQCEQIGTIVPGTNYAVQGKNDDRSWLQIGFRGQSGWVSADYVALSDSSLMFAVPNTGHSSSCLLLQTMDSLNANPSAQMNAEQQQQIIDQIQQTLLQAGFTAQEVARTARNIEAENLKFGLDCGIPIGIGLSALAAASVNLSPDETIAELSSVIGGELLRLGLDPDSAQQCAQHLADLFAN